MTVKKCSNPQRHFKIGKLDVTWQLASFYWVQESENKIEVRHWLAASTVSKNGRSATRLIIGRLAVWLAWI